MAPMILQILYIQRRQSKYLIMEICHAVLPYIDDAIEIFKD